MLVFVLIHGYNNTDMNSSKYKSYPTITQRWQKYEGSWLVQRPVRTTYMYFINRNETAWWIL